MLSVGPLGLGARSVLPVVLRRERPHAVTRSAAHRSAPHRGDPRSANREPRERGSGGAGARGPRAASSALHAHDLIHRQHVVVRLAWAMGPRGSGTSAPQPASSRTGIDFIHAVAAKVRRRNVRARPAEAATKGRGLSCAVGAHRKRSSQTLDAPEAFERRCPTAPGFASPHHAGTLVFPRPSTVLDRTP